MMTMMRRVILAAVVMAMGGVAMVEADPGPAEGVVNVTKGNTAFAVELMKAVSQKEGGMGGNVFLSPYSVSSALAMTWVAARGKTAEEMAGALRFSGKPSDVAGGFAGVQGVLAAAEVRSGTKLVVANSLWPELVPERPLLPAYVDEVTKSFGAAVKALDFRGQANEAAREINQWVEEKTNSKIKNLLHEGDVDAATRLVLANAIYFKGHWAEPFVAERNEQADFHQTDGRSGKVTLMHQTSNFPGYAEIEAAAGAAGGVQLLEMGYFGDAETGAQFVEGRVGTVTAAGGRGGAGGAVADADAPRTLDPRSRSMPELSMVLILPKVVAGTGGLGEVMKGLTAEKLAGWLGHMKRGRVEVYMPKFKVEGRYMLKEVLEGMGMKEAFKAPMGEGGADFSGMNGAKDLFIGVVVHQTFIDVNEEGTEAAAATAVGMSTMAMPAGTPPVFRADRPFLYLIRENRTGSILFMGKLETPGK